jgi:hypothetical protein
MTHLGLYLSVKQSDEKTLSFNVNLKAHNIEIPPFYFMQNDLSSASVVGKLPDLSLKCVDLLQFESGIYL